ncbi:MAG: carbohydrate kinase [Spirochaetaceae bacterium]|jgi:sugar (pentulose or hexulose) kinase|nr:carbohydrate kinase [Spirochaetaceae bacterium]
MEYAIGVIDIGMTNKKVAIYDETLRQVDARYRNFPPRIVRSERGLETETHDLAAMEEWFTRELTDFARSYPIRGIAVTTHGATFVCVGKDGKPAVPCVYYTHEPGDNFDEGFYRQFGNPRDLQARTGTPRFKALINTGKGICFAKEQFPGAFKNTTHLLLYPQYWGFRLTGQTGAEGTYMGCHSYLWDQVDHTLSSVAKDLGVASLLPGKLSNSWDVLGTIRPEFAEKTGLSKDTLVTMGIHDSNSSLLPHFAKKGDSGFVLNSTGTWCVLMNPVKKYGFAPDELGKVVFFNISAFGFPVKTAIFLGGQEFESWSGVLMGIHHRQDLPPYDPPLYRSILAERKSFLLPELTAGSGQFPNSKPRVTEEGLSYPYGDIAGGKRIPPSFNNYERGFALLRISLVMQTLTALERTGLDSGSAPGAAAPNSDSPRPPAEVFTEGGFRKNEAYNALLSAALRRNRVFLTDIAEASAFGAAMTAKMALTGKALGDLAKDFTVEYQEVPKADIPEIFPYREAWLREVGR